MALRRLIPIRVLLAALVALPVVMSPATALAYTADAYEAGAGDDTPATARDITTLIDSVGSYGFHGLPMSAESHTFDVVNDVAQTSDVDWIKFTVTQADIDEAYSYVIEAVAVDGLVDPVIELYGPAASSAAVTPTDIALLGPSVEATMFTETDPVADAANDEGRWFSMTSASLSFIPNDPGVYYARVRPYYQYEGGDLPSGFGGGEGRYTLRVKNGQFTRLSGANRIDTAVAISRERFQSMAPASGAVVLANAYGFADALAGSTLAGVLGAPVLLTPADALPASVGAEIKRLGATTVYVLGGTSAVNSGVLTQISALGATPVRVFGVDRIATAGAVARKASEIAPTSSVAFIVSSRNFPDALAASPMATYNGAPVLLTAPAALDSRVAAVLSDPAMGITDAVIVGGTAAISDTAAAQIATALGGASHVRRIAGVTRYDTARDFAVWATGVQTGTSSVGTVASPDALATLDFERIGVANGANFPDALAGGVFCGLAGSPILLTESTTVSPYLLTPPPPYGHDYWFASDLAVLGPGVLRHQRRRVHRDQRPFHTPRNHASRPVRHRAACRAHGAGCRARG